MAPSKQRQRGSRPAGTPASWEGVTTVMLRNIPSRYNQPMLVAEVYRAGFEGLVDFFYLPMDFHKQTNAGYAFLNFTSTEHVALFRKRFDGERLNGGKLLLVVPAAIQGYTANREHLAHSAVLNHHKPEHGPLFLREGDSRDPGRKRGPRAYAYSLTQAEPYLLEAPGPSTSSPLDEVVQRADAYAWACTAHGMELSPEAFSALDGLASVDHGEFADLANGEWDYAPQDLPTLRESRDLDDRFRALGLETDDGLEPWCFATPDRPGWRPAQDCSPLSDLDTLVGWPEDKPDSFDFTKKDLKKDLKGAATPSTCASAYSPQREDLGAIGQELSAPFQLPWLLPPVAPSGC